MGAILDRPVRHKAADARCCSTVAVQFPVGVTVSATEQNSDVAHCASVKEAAQITIKAASLIALEPSTVVTFCLLSIY